MTIIDWLNGEKLLLDSNFSFKGKKKMRSPHSK